MNICSNGNITSVGDLQIGLATVALLSADQSGPDVAADVVDVRVAAGAALDAAVGDHATGVRVRLQVITLCLGIFHNILILFVHDEFFLRQQWLLDWNGIKSL